MASTPLPLISLALAMNSVVRGMRCGSMSTGLDNSNDGQTRAPPLPATATGQDDSRTGGVGVAAGGGEAAGHAEDGHLLALEELRPRQVHGLPVLQELSRGWG